MTGRSSPGRNQDASQAELTAEQAIDEILNEKALLVTVGESRELAGELAQIFLQELDSRIQEMGSAILEADSTRLQFVAHALRGSAGSMSATQVAGTAGELETMARAGKLGEAAPTFTRLESEIAALRARLITLIRES